MRVLYYVNTFKENNYNSNIDQTIPLVSVAMATFNGALFLEEQLTSIFNQTYNNLEVIICDDGSNDGTAEILETFSNKHENLDVYINSKNLGFVGNFEKAISLCKGDYIALADQDDVWIDNKIECLIKEIGECSLIHSDATLIDAKGVEFSDSWSDFYNKNITQPFESYILSNNNITGCTCLFTKELKKLLLPIPSDVPYHDWWLAIVAYYNGGISYSDKKLIGYRQHDSNHTGYMPTTLKESKKTYISRELAYLNTLLGYRDKIKLPEKSELFLRNMIKFYDYKLGSFYSLRSLYIYISNLSTIKKASKTVIGLREIIRAGQGSEYF